MRCLVYTGIIAAMLLIPVRKLDAAKLIPVEAVAVTVQEGKVVIKTDTNDKGIGSTADEAIANLKVNSTGIVYLDTTRYLLYTEEAKEYADQIEDYMTSCVRKGVYSGGDVAEEAKYLDAHIESEEPVSEK